MSVWPERFSSYTWPTKFSIEGKVSKLNYYLQLDGPKSSSEQRELHYYWIPLVRFLFVLFNWGGGGGTVDKR